MGLLGEIGWNGWMGWIDRYHPYSCEREESKDEWDKWDDRDYVNININITHPLHLSQYTSPHTQPSRIPRYDLPRATLPMISRDGETRSITLMIQFLLACRLWLLLLLLLRPQPVLDPRRLLIPTIPTLTIHSDSIAVRDTIVISNGHRVLEPIFHSLQVNLSLSIIFHRSTLFQTLFESPVFGSLLR